MRVKTLSKQMKPLTIVGLGPGDPSLITLAAVNAIEESTVVSYPVTNKGEESLAEVIASRWISDDKKKLPLHFPMVTEQKILKNAWCKAGNELMKMVKNGEKVVFIAQGDVSLFSTGSYLSMELERNHPDCVVKLVPGVTSFAMAAAKSKFPLALRDEQLLIAPVPESSLKLKSILLEAEVSSRVVVFLKLGNKWTWVKPLLQELNVLENSIFAQRIGFEDEKIMKASDMPSSCRPYFSLLLIRKSLPLGKI